MLEPETMTTFQKVLWGLKILDGYLSRENPGEIACEHDEIMVGGVHVNVLGGDDRAMLEAMGWRWSREFEAWKRSV